MYLYYPSACHVIYSACKARCTYAAFYATWPLSSCVAQPAFLSLAHPNQQLQFNYLQIQLTFLKMFSLEIEEWIENRPPLSERDNGWRKLGKRAEKRTFISRSLIEPEIVMTTN